LIGFVLFLLLLAIALSLPFVQTKIAQYATNSLNEKFGTNISIDKVAINVFGGVKLKGVLVLDHHNDTLISATRLQTSVLSFKNIADSRLEFGTIRAEGMNLHMKTYKKENFSNLDKFIKAFDNGQPGTGKFRMRAKDLYVTNGRFRLTNENGVTPKVLDFKKLNGELGDFFIKGSDITANIKKLSLVDHRGLEVKNLKSAFTYTKKNILLEELELVTKESALKGAIKLSYKKDDMKDFVNRVDVDFIVDKATVSSNELNYFYNEFGRNQKFYLSTRLKGTLNNFILHDLKLLDAKNSEIIGSINFRHLFDKKGPGFYMNGNFDRVTSNFNNLKSIMPRILGKSLPPVLGKFGRVDLTGDVMLTKKNLEADVYLMSELGEAQTDLAVDDYNKPDLATYTGTINLNGFNLGSLIGDDKVGTATVNLEVNGRGFNKQSLNTVVKGDIQQLAFNNYNYTNIAVDGRMKWPYFEGSVNSKDPNLTMTFDGLVDMSNRRNKYDFHAQIEYANLKALGFMKKDSISVVKGDLLLDATGNNLNDLAGKLQVSQLSYQTNRGEYTFEDFAVESVFDEENVRTVTINSTDIIEGYVRGKFDAKQLPKLVENALGSLYTNYSPHKVTKGQFLSFDLTIYNKIINVLTPDVEVAENTVLKGSINADKGEFRLAFNSPGVEAFKNKFSNIIVDVNNKNPLYNAYVQMDSMRVKNYKISDFSLINVTRNDTLFLRSEFKGGSQSKDFYNLNLYHTIDEENRSVVGFHKSEVNFKNYLWYLNEHEEQDNRIVFNKKLTDFAIDRITLSHNDQKVELAGLIKGKDYKDVKLTFDDVQLDKVTPSLDSLSFGGKLNGEVSLKQNKNEFHPASSITIDSLKLNKFLLGDLDMQVTGDQSLRKFNVNTTINRNGIESFFTNGFVEIVDKQTLLSLDAGLSGFDLAPLEIFLKSIFPDIRGLASGRATIVGNVKDPQVDGRLYLKGAGLKVGYLNTDYNFEEDAAVDLNQENFWFRNIKVTDTKYGTSGILKGNVTHKFFKNWELDLDIESDRLLVIDTEDSDEALFYGTAFIDGEASISGPTTSLYIKVDATSKEGTDMKLPLNNTAAAGGTAPYIHFTTPEEKANEGKGIVTQTKTYNGIEMEFNFTITPEARIEVIIDKNTGHGLTTRGNGYMLLNVNTLGKFNMWGDYSVTEGTYNFKYGGLIDKKFVVKPHGTINWDGDPTRARLDMEAIYKTKANPAVLLENASINRPIDVELNILLRGNLMAPEHEFQINFPTASSVVKSDLEYRLNDFDTRQLQAFSLLSSGTFTSPNSNSNLFVGSLFETAGSMVGDIFSNGEGESKVDVNFNYVQGENNPYIETNSQVGVTVSTQINDRISVNGQVGVPVGGVNESQIVGNIEVLARLNEENTLKARVFNRETDINFLGEGVGYTQGVGLTYEVDFDTLSELFEKLFGKTKKEEETTADDQVPDSEFTPDYIKFIEGRNKKKPNEPEPQRIPETD
jgi:hypothetical protein